MPKPFINLGWVKKKHRNPMMRQLKKFMDKEISKPCTEFVTGCCVCEAWVAFAKLDSMFETPMDKDMKKK